MCDSDPHSGAAEPSCSVHIRFAPSQGRRLQRPESLFGDDGPALWQERPVLMERADGTYDLIGTTARPDALVRWVLSHGAAATVRGPERLRERVAAEARRIWAQHDAEQA